MSQSLDAAKGKVQRGEKHFGDFKDIVFGRSTGIDTRPTIRTHYTLPPGPPAVPNVISLPAECRLAFGDAVHQLRSALDHVIYALVEARTADLKVLRRVDFPIFVDEDSFHRSPTVVCLKSALSAEPFAEILNLQPFRQSPAEPVKDWLWVLGQLDNIDKHRTILDVDPKILIKSVGADGQVTVAKHPLIPGQGLSIPVPESEVAEIALVVVLANTGLRCDNITAIKVWRELIDSAKKVISTFERFF